MITRFIMLSAIMLIVSLSADEGQYPVSEISKLDLKAKGLEMDPNDIFNPEKTTISDAIVNIGGCTGSFVSPEGLILTNHHCAFRAAQMASTTENDYLSNGFSADGHATEIPAPGYTVRITELYRDVSADVLTAVTPDMTGIEREKAVSKRIKELVQQAEDEFPGKRCDISEMFIGKSYMLFVYTYIRDVRLVYIPPRDIGEFGGEEDNWMWPRHNADFALMRAYVGPDGESAEYSEDNEPYEPKTYLRINPDGVNEGDFVMILGYPGRTYRHRTSYYLDYEQNYRMPFVAGWYARQIDIMEKRGKEDPALELMLSARIKGLSNTMKNYRGKLQGLKRIDLLSKWREREARLREYIAAGGERQERYGDILPELEKMYNERMQEFDRNAVLGYLNGSPYLLGFAFQAFRIAEERAKPDMERDSWYMDRNFDRFKQNLLRRVDSYDEAVDKAILKALVEKALKLPDDQRIKALDEYFGDGKDLDARINELYTLTRVVDKDVFTGLVEGTMKPEDLETDPVIKLTKQLMPDFKELDDRGRERAGRYDELLGRLVDVQREFMGSDFVPDANGTYRLSYGYIRGYQPNDAVWNEPFTTLDGVIEKDTGEEPFVVPDKLKTLYREGDFAPYALEKSGRLPVCMLYNLDTTGGNSGSPVLNARGELIGLNFDRAYTATINDFAWNEAYSRSIGVDVRYILWLLDKYAGAEDLLDEMGVD